MEDSPQDGRVPPPPRQGGALFGLAALATVVLLGGALFGGGTWATTGETMRLGLQILGGALLVPGLIAGALVVPAVLYRVRNRPARELCWWPLVVGEPASITFAAERARYHGIWLCLDVPFPGGRGPFYVASTLEVRTSERTLCAEQIATSWGFAGDATGGTGLYTGDRRARRLGIAPSVLEMDRIIESRPTWRFRALSLLLRAKHLRPGEQVTVTVTVHPPSFSTELRAHAFVALPP